MTEQMTAEEARQVLADELQKDKIECQRELGLVLEKYNCQLLATVQVTSDGRLFAAPTLVNAPPQERSGDG